MAGHGRQWLLGLPVDLVTMAEAIALCVTRASNPASPPLRVLTLNPEMVVRALRDQALADCFLGEVLVVPDGIGIVIAGWRRGWPRFARVTGIDLLARLADEAAQRSWPVFLYGGEPGVAEKAAAALRRRYPGLMVAGTAAGFLSSKELAELPAAIAGAGARILFVGLGVPRQELWLARNLGATGARVGVGVGGSFDIAAGRAKRAPRLWRQVGLEWVYRAWQDPRRWRRLLVLPGFLWRALWPPKTRGGDGS